MLARPAPTTACFGVLVQYPDTTGSIHDFEKFFTAAHAAGASLAEAAQALLALLMSGVGNLLGYLGGGWWHQMCQTSAGTDWSKFWWGETAVTAAVCLFFALAYQGRKASAV